MIIRKLDSSHDWTFGKGLADYATAEQAIEENIETRILSWIGDCFFALDDGIDWKSRLDVGQQGNLENEIKANILQAFGVVGVNAITTVFSGTTRLFDLTYNIDTIYSTSFQSTLQLSGGQ